MTVLHFPRVGRKRLFSEMSGTEQRRWVIEQLFENAELARALGQRPAEREARKLLASVDWQIRDLDIVV